ncbi:NAD(P)-binding protein [Aureobasidium pullulans]|uniref:NAD(P)-binding protein n=1 Tax=Aureobasidium pullulans TaxID=5580 RepID=A0A4S9I0I5_AURPU|nr:NAD(P)-binding protein [Aureobasidium pullulans]THZ74943.1 NAD(P)-binding protein [Aureobasidium pullulans]
MDYSSILTFLYSQFFIVPEYPEKSCKGQVFIVTGANVGLGLEASRHLVRLGADKVILACRNLEKGEAAVKDIEQSTKRTGVAEVWSLDLSSFESVKEFAKKVDKLPRIDSIVENAGISTTKFQVFEGNESTITVNVISTFLLALLVLPALKRSAQRHNIQPRLTIVASEVHHWTNIPERNKRDSIFEALASPEDSEMGIRYPVSKLLDVFGTRALVERTSSSYPVTINTMNPGFCYSELSRESSGIGFWLMYKLLARTTEVGGRTLVAAALGSPETHGQYMSNSKVEEPSKFVRSEEGKKTQERVWAELSAKLEQIQPGILQNI